MFLQHHLHFCNTSFILKGVLLLAKKSNKHKPLMEEFTRFTAETPLWLLIVFFTVFAAMCVTFVVLLVQALRK